MIEIDNLFVSYDKRSVLKDLRLKIEPSSIHGLLGLNGAGKTSLLNVIYGIKKPDSGSLVFHNKPLKRSYISYLETENYFYPGITAYEYLSLMKVNTQKINIDSWNELFELPLKQLIDSYSNGMKKRLAFFGLICLNKDIILLDEPFNGMDMETVQKTKTILKQLKSANKTIIITSHILESLFSLCDSISYINNGHIQFTKTKAGFADIEDEIFDLHQENLNETIKNLLGDFSNE